MNLQIFPVLRHCAVLVLAVALVPTKLHAAVPSVMEMTRFKAAAAYSHSRKGTGVLVMRRGQIIFEDYASDWTADKPHLLASGTKSFAGVMAACAVQDELLKLDEKVADTLTEWKSDARKSQITIRQLISLSSGINGGEIGSAQSYAIAVETAEATALPDEKFSYGPIPFQCFGELMRRKLGKESVEAYLHRRILDPIGLEVGFWRKDAENNISMPAGAFLTPRQWVKFGELVRLGGKWNDTQIVPAELLAECFKPSSTNAAYGMTWWLLGAGDESSTRAADGGNVDPRVQRSIEERTQLGFQPPRDTVAAIGKGKNCCYVIPSLELVVVRMGDSVGREFSDNEFLAKLLGLNSVATPDAKATEPTWPQFRGPESAGFVEGQQPPERWSMTENVAWKAPIPGKGWSSPIVWGDRVFLTTVTVDEAGLEPRKGLYIQDLQGTVPKGLHHWLVLCLDLKSGKLLWKREVHQGTPASTIHLKNSYASETPVTDGTKVYAYFGNVGAFCFDFEGRSVWSKHFDAHETRIGWGTAASPALHDGKLFIVCDNEEESFLVALDTATGKQLWRVERNERSNWATPFVWQNPMRTELVVPATGKVRSYAMDGRQLWELGGMSKTSIPTPTAAHGLLYVSSGYVGDQVRPVFALKTGASGDISLKKDETQNEFIAWYLPQAGPYHPSPLVAGDFMYVLYDRGLFACYDALTGREVYGRQRLGSTAFTASPWYANGKIFCLNEDGETVILQAGPEFKILGTNALEDMALATPAIVDDRLLIRTLSQLYCLDAAASTGTESERQ